MHQARRLWQLLEPCHALVYFAPERTEEYAAAGLRGGWMGYFASRSAPMGAVGAGVVVATFHNFAPRMVERAIPDAWSFSSPERVLQARHAVASRALRRVLGDGADSPEVAAAAELLRAALTGCDPAGRPLFASYVRLPWPEQPHLALWHAGALLREHRFDGHVATLLVEGLDGVEAHLTLNATGGLDPETLRGMRGWTEEEWAAGAERLRTRGIVDGDGGLTHEGRRLRVAVEEGTDVLAGEPCARLGADGVERVAALVRPVVDAIVDASAFPYPNPVGIPRPGA